VHSGPSNDILTNEIIVYYVGQSMINMRYILFVVKLFSAEEKIKSDL
jgi:hypothetical protein